MEKKILKIIKKIHSWVSIRKLQVCFYFKIFQKDDMTWLESHHWIRVKGVRSATIKSWSLKFDFFALRMLFVRLVNFAFYLKRRIQSTFDEGLSKPHPFSLFSLPRVEWVSHLCTWIQSFSSSVEIGYSINSEKKLCNNSWMRNRRIWWKMVGWNMIPAVYRRQSWWW